MKSQRLTNTKGEVWATVSVIAGPHQWQVGDYGFATVLVRCPEPDHEPPATYSVIACRSGLRLGRVKVRAPKTRPHSALTAVSNLIDQLRLSYSDRGFIERMRNGAPLP